MTAVYALSPYLADRVLGFGLLAAVALDAVFGDKTWTGGKR